MIFCVNLRSFAFRLQMLPALPRPPGGDGDRPRLWKPRCTAHVSFQSCRVPCGAAQATSTMAALLVPEMGNSAFAFCGSRDQRFSRFLFPVEGKATVAEVRSS